MTAYTPTITKQIELPASGLPRDTTVTLRLIAADDLDEAVGYCTGDGVSVHGTRTVKPTTAGLATFTDVRPNFSNATTPSTTLIDLPAGTVYEVVTKIGKRPAVTEYISVPDTALDYEVSQIITDAPATLSTPAAAAAQATATARMIRTGKTFGVAGDSIAAGTTDAAGPVGLTRPANAAMWPIAIGGTLGDFTLLANRGSGGSSIGGQGVLAAAATAGDLSVSIDVTHGSAYPFRDKTVYIGGFRASMGDFEAKLVAATVDADTTPTVFTTVLTNSYPAGTPVYWGTIGTFDDPLLGFGATGAEGVGGLFPDYIAIHTGTNDLETGLYGLSDQQFEDALNALIDKAEALPSSPMCVLDAMCPRDNLNDDVRRRNTIIERVAHERGHAYADVHSPLCAADGTFDDDLNDDGTHPNQQGAQRAADVLLRVLDRIGSTKTGQTPFCVSAADPYSMLPDGTFRSGLSNGGVGVTAKPVGWTLNFGGALTGWGNPWSIVAPARSDHVVGNWCKITATAGSSGTVGMEYTMSPTAGAAGSPIANAAYPGWVAGDYLFIAAKVRATGFDGLGGAKYIIRVIQSDGFSIDCCYQWVQDWDCWVVQTSVPTDAGITTLKFVANLTTDGTTVAPCSLEVAQLTCYDRTQLQDLGVWA